MRPSLQNILNAVAETYGVEPGQLLEQASRRPFPEARGVFSVIALELGYPLDETATALRRKPNTTIVNMRLKIKRAIDSFQPVRDRYFTVKQLLHGTQNSD